MPRAELRRATAASFLLLALGCSKPEPREPPSHLAPPDDAAADAALDVDGGHDAGTEPAPHGHRFSLWAPHADAVELVGSFNNDEPLAMRDRGNGQFVLDVDGVAVGDRYHFAVHHGDEVLARVDPRALGWDEAQKRSLIVQVEGLSRQEQRRARPLPEQTIVYELHPGTFFAPTAGQPATLLEAISGLDHLVDLGVNVIELMPVHEFPGARSWGYNPDLLFVVESAYGGPSALRAFVSAAHERGLSVVLDVIYNHLNGATPLCRFDGWTLTEPCGGIYFYNDARGLTDWGPRPDFGREGVRRYLRDNVSLWLSTYGLDGLRLDSTSNIWNTNNGQGETLAEGRTLLQEINDDIDALGPNFLSIAEDLHAGSAVTRSTKDDGLGFDAQWDTGFHAQLLPVLTRAETVPADVQTVMSAMLHSYAPSSFARVIFTESHDSTGKLNKHVRLPNEISPQAPAGDLAKRRTLLGAALLLTAPGIPMLLQGQELLVDGSFHDDAPIDWKRLEANRDVLAVYKALIALRTNRGHVTRGLSGQTITVTHLNVNRGVLVYDRKHQGGPGDDVLVIANMSAKPLSAYRVGVPAAGTWHVRLDTTLDGTATTGSTKDSEAKAYDGMPSSLLVELAPESVLILSQDAETTGVQSN